VTIRCDDCCSVIQDVVQGPARLLQEAVAQDCCQRLLQLDARVSAVQVYIYKPHVALTGTLDSVGEFISRRNRFKYVSA
jgi:dihydroneopterin aldolase